MHLQNDPLLMTLAYLNFALLLLICGVVAKLWERPINKPGDPDTRGAFMDFAGNDWSVSTQTN